MNLWIVTREFQSYGGTDDFAGILGVFLSRESAEAAAQRYRLLDHTGRHVAEVEGPIELGREYH